jgi:uncharacterized integral membrane protein (TIGR00698 family)
MKNINGLLLVIVLSITSMLVHELLLPSIETLTIGIVIGILVYNLISIPTSFQSGINYSLKKVLKWGIVLLGVKLNFNLIIELGLPLLLMIIFLMTVALLLSNYIGKKLHLNKYVSTLIGVGSSICGASAIVAMAPVINADEDDTATAVAVISILGTLGVLVYTFFAQILPIDDSTFGIWSGSTLQGVSHALAAAGARGDVSLEIGTLVKMARVALLAPVALILGSLFKSNSNNTVKFPIYVLYFILVGAFTTFNNEFMLIPTSFTLFGLNINIISFLKSISSFFILMAMISMGMKVDFKSINKESLKSLILGLLVFLILSGTGIILSLMIT